MLVGNWVFSPKFVLLAALVWSALLTSSCEYSGHLSGTQIPQPPSTLVVSETATTTTQPTRTVSTIQSTFTNTPQPTIAPSPTITPSPTPTNLPTLSEKDAQIRLVDLLANNGDCRLPCLWGISPGNSTYQEAKNILAPLSSISEFTAFSPEVGNILPFYINGDSNVLIDVAFLVKDNLVTSISFGGRALKDVIDKQGIRGSENVFDSKTFGAQLGVYMLPNILSTYGRPSSVMLATLGKVPPSNRDPGVNFNI